jgi:hypothetical protein
MSGRLSPRRPAIRSPRQPLRRTSRATSYVLAARATTSQDTTEHPASATFVDPGLEAGRGLQFSATELLSALEHLREADVEQRPFDLTRLWEDDPDEALAAALDRLDAAA